MALRIRNWEKFQHFKDRTPPWVKLYRDILDDPDWHELDGDCAKTLTMLWLIASEDETHRGVLPNVRKLAFRLRISEGKLNQQLNKLSHWLLHDDITPISERYQVDAPETETETETYKPETEKDVRATRFDAQAHLVSIGVDESIASDWVQSRKQLKASPTRTAINGISKEADRAGISLSDALAMCCQRGWRGFKAEWVKEKSTPGFQDKRQERDSAFLAAIGMSSKRDEVVIDGEVLP